MKKIFCLGIGGVGMSALALYLKEAGYTVLGSDVSDFRLRQLLESKGIQVFLRHDKNNLVDIDLLIYSTAVPSSNPELLHAESENIPRINRLEALQRFLGNHQIISVTGSYGKSTTTAFTASLMDYCGFSPSWLIGADLFSFPPAKYNHSNWVVLETDESKPEFLDFDPYAVVLTNIGKDHLPNYDESQTNLIREIKKFIQRRNQKAKPILNGDDLDIISSLIDNNPKENYILCGLDSRNNYQVIDSKTTWKENAFCNDFTLKCPDGTLVQTRIPMPGEKNAIDAVMALAMCVQLGGDLQKSIQGLPHLPTMDRRFEIYRSNQTTIVIDDEGDSPEVIKTVLQNCKEWFPQKKLIAVLQPHRYSRLKSLFDDYVEVMSHIADEVILLPVYSAGEKEIMGINSETLMNSIVNQGFLKKNIHSLSREEACSLLRNKLTQNYAIITLGPGDVWKVAESLAKN